MFTGQCAEHRSDQCRAVVACNGNTDGRMVKEEGVCSLEEESREDSRAVVTELAH